MDYGLVPANEWAAFKNINDAKENLIMRCNSLVALLSETAGGNTLIGANTVEISTDEAGITNIKTPVGNGRFIILWTVAEGELRALMSFERERWDQYGRQFWEPVWDIKVPRYDNPILGTGETAFAIPLNESYSQRLPNAIFAVLMSMLYGITNGPQIAK